MSRKPPATSADYMIVAINPALIMLLVGSVLFFLCEVFYRGQYEGRLTFICAMYVMGIVAVSRISMEEGAGYAAGFGAPLAAVVYIAFFKFVEFHGPMAALSPLLNAVFLAFTWWLAYKLTWDCTLLDDKADSSGQGLLEAAGFDVAAGAPANGTAPQASNASSPVPAPEERPRAPMNAAEKLLAEKEKYERERLEEPSFIEKWFEADRRQRAQGVWVLWFAAIALPIFGVMQWFVPSSETGSRVWCLQLLLVYVGSSLALLLNTSFLSLRRYLRQRHLEMPLEMAGVWMIVGAALIGGVMLFCLLLPRPGAEIAMSQPPITFGNSNLHTSRWGMGNDGKKQQGGSGQSQSGPQQGSQSSQQSSGQNASQSSNSQTQGSQSQGSPSQGSPSQASQSQGSQSQGSQSQGSQSSGGPSSQNSQQQNSNNASSGSKSGQSSGGGSQQNSGQPNPSQQSAGPSADKSPANSSNSSGQQPMPGSNSPQPNSQQQSSSQQNSSQQNSAANSGAKPPDSGSQTGPNQNSSKTPDASSSNKTGSNNSSTNNPANNSPSNSSPNNQSADNSAKNDTSGKANPGEKSDSAKSDASKSDSSKSDNTGNKSPEASKTSPGDPPKGNQSNNSSANPSQNNSSQTQQSQSQQSNAQSSSTSSPTPPRESNFRLPSIQVPTSLGNLLKLALWAAIAIGVVWGLIRYREQLAAAWKQLLDELAKLWARLFGGGEVETAAAEATAAKPNTPPRPFASYPNPFTSGLASRMPPPQLMGHTLAAAEAFGRERGFPRDESETPHEYLTRLFQQSPEVVQLALAFAETYGQIAFGKGAPPQQAHATSQRLWQVMSTTPPPPPPMAATPQLQTAQR